MHDDDLPDVPGAHDVALCCASAIERLAAAAADCCEQHECHKQCDNEAACECCREALQLTCDAIAKHLECLRNCC